jgi:hypothetical protein
LFKVLQHANLDNFAVCSKINLFNLYKVKNIMLFDSSPIYFSIYYLRIFYDVNNFFILNYSHSFFKSHLLVVRYPIALYYRYFQFLKFQVRGDFYFISNDGRIS